MAAHQPFNTKGDRLTTDPGDGHGYLLPLLVSPRPSQETALLPLWTGSSPKMSEYMFLNAYSAVAETTSKTVNVGKKLSEENRGGPAIVPCFQSCGYGAKSPSAHVHIPVKYIYLNLTERLADTRYSLETSYKPEHGKPPSK